MFIIILKLLDTIAGFVEPRAKITRQVGDNYLIVVKRGQSAPTWCRKAYRLNHYFLATLPISFLRSSINWLTSKAN